MKILDKAILVQFLRTFVLASLCFVCLFVLNLFLDIAGSATEAQEVDNREAFLVYYLLYSIPEYWNLTLPFALLFAAVFTLAKRKELKTLLIMEASGIRFSRIVAPILVTAFFFQSFKGLFMNIRFW